jgi:hypothetical protein
MIENLMQTSGTGPYKLMVERLRDNGAGKQVESMSASPEEIGALIARIAETRTPKARYVAPFHAKLILFVNWLLCDRLPIGSRERCSTFPQPCNGVTTDGQADR